MHALRKSCRAARARERGTASRGYGWLLVACAAGVSIADGADAETRSYVVSYFTAAMYSVEGDCEGGPNSEIVDQWRRGLIDVGMTPEAAGKMVLDVKGDKRKERAIATEAIVNRGRIDGKPVNAYANPHAVKDPNMTAASGRFLRGFNLDDKGADRRNAFEDPDTHERGIDNQLVRVFGCIKVFRARPPERSAHSELWWKLTADSMPAWLILIEGADLSQDGEVTVTLVRSVDHVRQDANSETRWDSTFRVDPRELSRNVFRGRIRGGVLTTTGQTDVSLGGDALVLPTFEMLRSRLRLTLKADGTLDGIIGGYQPWVPLYYGVLGGSAGFSRESNAGINLPGVYHLLRRLSDGDPDPRTGKNMTISATWRLEAVPAFVTRGDGADRTLSSRPDDQPSTRMNQ